MLYLFLILAAALSAEPVDRHKSEITVHEWGTFTSVAGRQGDAEAWSPLSGPDDLPCFVKRIRFPFSKLSLSGRVRMETPVLYFYSPLAAEVSVAVKFPHGLITEWYPDAKVKTPAIGQPIELETAGGGIEWNRVRILPQGPAEFPVEPGLSHYYAARRTEANPVAVDIDGAHTQQDRFLFYRGAGGFDPPVSVTASEPEVRIRAIGPDRIPALILFENRDGRIGFRVQGAFRGSITLPRPKLDADLDAVLSSLRGALLAGGLFPQEAQAMIETWRDAWFEEGSRLLYIVPPAFVDSELPLSLNPAPAQLVRVFVGRAEFLTPDIARSIEGALKTRDRGVLARYGRFAAPHVLSLMPGLTALEQSFGYEALSDLFRKPGQCPIQ